MLWAHQGAKRACWSAQRGVRHLTQSRGILDHADPMLQKNRMGNRQHRYIWVTNRAFQQKNRRTGIMRKTGYRILVFTECKQKHILTKSCETLEQHAAYLFILLWLSPTAVELKPKGPNSCRVSDAVWLEGRSPMLCQGFCSSCRFTFIASLKYL